MPSTIFNGTKVKVLKSTLNLNGGADIINSATDPTSSAVSADPGSLLLNSSTGKLYRKNDSGSSTNWTEVGSGGSGINYITNPSASTNTTGWNTYADAAGSQPVDGTGGVPNVTWTRSTTTPLRGSADFEFAKDAVNRQGQGVATDITIDLADQAKVLTVTFDYEVLSGTYATGDLTVYLIADPSGTPIVIQPAGYQVQAATSGTKMKQIATFQTQSIGQTYRVCFHVASTSASAYTLAIDNVVVGPQVVQYGAPITDWVAYTPTITNGAGTITATLTGAYRRVGDSVDVQIQYVYVSGTGAAADFQISLPSGISISGLTSENLGGSGYFYTTAGGFTNTNARTVSSTSVRFTKNAVSGFLQGTDADDAGAVLTVTFRARVTGWSSTVQMSNDTDTRVVALRATVSAGQTWTATTTPQKLVFGSVTTDTHGAYSSNTYTIPVSGHYILSAMIFCNTVTQAINAYNEIHVYIDGVNTFRLDRNIQYVANSDFTLKGSSAYYLNAGQTVSFYWVSATSTTATKVNDPGLNYIAIERMSGPSAIAASETIAAFATKTSGSHTSTANWQDVASWTLRDSSHGAFDATTGIFTAPISGRYLVASVLNFAGNATGNRGVKVLKGSANTVIGELVAANASGNAMDVAGYVNLDAGETCKVQAYQNSGGNLNYSTSSEYGTTIAIVRVGNQ